IVRAGHMEAFLDQLSKHIFQHLIHIDTFLRKRVVQRREASLGGGKLYGAIGKGGEETVNLVEQAMAQPAAGGGVKIETHRHMDDSLRRLGADCLSETCVREQKRSHKGL